MQRPLDYVSEQIQLDSHKLTEAMRHPNDATIGLRDKFDEIFDIGKGVLVRWARESSEFFCSQFGLACSSDWPPS